jgi:hypothetical protein
MWVAIHVDGANVSTNQRMTGPDRLFLMKPRKDRSRRDVAHQQ